MKSVLLLITLITASSCAYRTKGIVGIREASKLEGSIALSSKIEIEYPNYVTQKQREELRFFEINDSADFVITELTYTVAPPAFYCGTGLPISFLISFVTLGIIPLHLTTEMAGNMVVLHRPSGKIKKIKFEAKTTESWSIWNRIKVGRDPEWTREETTYRSYFKDYLESKILR